MIRRFLYILYIGMFFPVAALCQINTDRVMTIGKNALYFEDYVLSIQYFNQVIGVKPYLAEPYFYRGLAKMNLDDYQGAEADRKISACGTTWRFAGCMRKSMHRHGPTWIR